MFRSIQIKILLIIITIALLMLAGITYFFIYQLEQADPNYAQLSMARTVAIVVIVAFIAISVVIVLFASRTIISPISKLIKNAKKIAEGEELDKFLRNSWNRSGRS